MFGYPSGADTQVPTEARGTLRNDQAAAPPNQRPDPRDFVLIEAGSVRQGFSGGPIIGPGGRVFGMLKGIVVNRDHGPSEHARPTGMAIGAGTRPIGTFLHREMPQLDTIAATHLTSADSANDARKAVVHVYCWQ